jgi:tRNA pseudouridine38-40 synthase
MRIAAILEYDGSNFCGWQMQNGDRTVQGAVETALSKVADQALRVTVAGRTDTGVHACGQVIHFDTDTRRKDFEWLRGANSNLPADVAMLWVGEVEASFHARFAAIGRRYRYVILNRAVRPTFLARRVSWDHRPLDVAAMQLAAQYLIGAHDFTSFRAAQCQAKDPVRELRRLDVARQQEFVIIEVEANGFLHHMVRNIAGVLSSVGAGEQSPAWVHEVLLARDRSAGGVTAAADGLYLMRVQYPPHYRLPPTFGRVGVLVTC